MNVRQDYKRRGATPLTDRYTPELVGHLIRALADDPNVVAFGWEQYTPYFNDGDTCEFGVHDLWVRTVLDDENEDRWSLQVSDQHPTLGFKTWHYDQATRTSSYVTHEQKFPETYKLADELAGVIQGAEITLLEWFGDHAEVVVTAKGIEVSEYGHD